ncbi:hypothetical protein DPMN_193847 [Dreissena polymorpha]|uniref:Uncharacterized protein n=1 Tax=Dreissena polymorpha TaxID=45954 RepID=A0A9D4BGG9_DREPO|nr:hypothetical protein DPMN_193847 [Dreissena polymorpha]
MISLFSPTPNNRCRKTNIVTDNSARLGLTINKVKSKLFNINASNNTPITAQADTWRTNVTTIKKIQKDLQGPLARQDLQRRIMEKNKAAANTLTPASNMTRQFLPWKKLLEEAGWWPMFQTGTQPKPPNENANASKTPSVKSGNSRQPGTPSWVQPIWSSRRQRK